MGVRIHLLCRPSSRSWYGLSLCFCLCFQLGLLFPILSQGFTKDIIARHDTNECHHSDVDDAGWAGSSKGRSAEGLEETG